MKNLVPPLVIVFLGLFAYSLYAAQDAMHRGERALAFILIVIALIFWKRIQRAS